MTVLAVQSVVPIVLIDIAIVIVVARLAGALFRKLRQPAVVGEIIAGIALGPSLLGLFPGNLPDRVFPVDARPFLNIVAQLGLVIFMFIVGLELDMKLIRGKERLAAVISITSVVLPFGLGFVLARQLHPLHNVVEGFPPVQFLPFALFLGAAMSITAFPVLARILTERGMHRVDVGALALACAAVDDILAWSLLAVVIAIAQAGSLGALPQILVLSVIYVALMFGLVKPLLARIADRYRAAGKVTPEIMAVVLVGILVSAYVTEAIGIHTIFGAFLFGVIMPRKDTQQLFHDLLDRLENVTTVLLLPVFFIATGINVDIRGLGLASLPSLGAILVVAIAGKFVGAAVAARSQGIPSQKAAAIGILMNTRGLTELVILNVGLSIGVLDRPLFTMMVIMAVVTTVMAEPLLRLAYPDRQLRRDIAEAEREALGLVDAYRVLVSVGEDDDPAALVDTALAFVGDERPAEIVLTRFAAREGGAQVSGGLVAELAAMAAATAPLNVQAARSKAQGVPCTVLSRFSADVAGDLLAQAEALEADVLLLGDVGKSTHDAEVAARLVSARPCDVVVLQAAAGGAAVGGPVAVPVGESMHDDAAEELAARVARALSAELRLLDEGAQGRRHARRTAALVQTATTFGVTAVALGPDESAAAAASTGVLVAGIDEAALARGAISPRSAAMVAAAAGPVLLVAAARDQARGGIDELVRRVQRQREREAAATGVGSAAGDGHDNQAVPATAEGNG